MAESKAPLPKGGWHAEGVTGGFAANGGGRPSGDNPSGASRHLPLGKGGFDCSSTFNCYRIVGATLAVARNLR